MEKLEAKLVEVIEAIEAGVMEHGDEALEIVLNVVRIEAIGQSLIWLVFVGLFAIALRQTLTGLHALSLREWDNLSPRDREQKEAVAGIRATGGLIVALFTGMGLALSFNIWAFAGILWPELKLAHDIIDRVLGGSS